ncbi:hypothetical protein MPSEU_000545500 [Mayamaea pseudoterrestris]|nr:hypothetical protein MPSEU_000545500 [Mayamaea pseudoterrestris]
MVGSSMTTTTTLKDAIRPFLVLKRLPGEELIVTHRLDDDDDADEEHDEEPNAYEPRLLDISIYQLVTGTHLWQLNGIPSEVLYDFIQSPGFIVRFSPHVYAVFADVEFMQTIQVSSSQTGEAFVQAGPECRGAAQYTDESEPRDVCALCRIFVPKSCMPLQETDRLQVQGTIRDVLRFQTSLPIFKPGEYERQISLTYNAKVDNALESKDVLLSRQDLQTMFYHCSWKHGAMLTLYRFQPSDDLWDHLEEFPFGDVWCFSNEIPRKFLQKTKSNSVIMTEANLVGSAVPFTVGSATIVMRDCSDFLSDIQAVDDFLDKWSTLSSGLEITHATFSTESWKHFWCSSILIRNNTCRSIKIRKARIGPDYFMSVHLAAIPSNLWAIAWERAEFIEGSSFLHARRIPSSLPDQVTQYFRPQDNPLYQDNSPLEVRQSILLEALHRSSNDPSQQLHVSNACIPTLLVPQTSQARSHDIDSSMIEHRALLIDHQVTIDMLVHLNNAMQQRHAMEGDELAILRRRLHALEEERRERRRYERRQESRMVALLESVRRVHGVSETFGESNSDNYSDEDSDESVTGMLPWHR